MLTQARMELSCYVAPLPRCIVYGMPDSDDFSETAESEHNLDLDPNSVDVVFPHSFHVFSPA